MPLPGAGQSADLPVTLGTELGRVESIRTLRLCAGSDVFMGLRHALGSRGILAGSEVLVPVIAATLPPLQAFEFVNKLGLGMNPSRRCRRRTGLRNGRTTPAHFPEATGRTSFSMNP
jgi:hypothetical protein